MVIDDNRSTGVKMFSYTNWTPEQYKAFKIAYGFALNTKKKSFVFENQEFLTGFAKYVIEYFDTIPKFSAK